jgi:hypothetical protein
MAAKKKTTEQPDTPDTRLNATLTLKDGTNNVALYGRLQISGNPDGLQMLGHGHRVKAMTEDTVILERACQNAGTEKQIYLDAGWTE